MYEIWLKGLNQFGDIILKGEFGVQLRPIMCRSNEGQKDIQMFQVRRVKCVQQCCVRPGRIGRLQKDVSRTGEEGSFAGAICCGERPDGRIQLPAGAKQGFEALSVR